MWQKTKERNQKTERRRSKLCWQLDRMEKTNKEDNRQTDLAQSDATALKERPKIRMQLKEFYNFKELPDKQAGKQQKYYLEEYWKLNNY